MAKRKESKKFVSPNSKNKWMTKKELMKFMKLPPEEKKALGHMTQYKTEQNIYVQSRVSGSDLSPMIEMYWEKSRAEFNPDMAFDFALGIIEVAIAAQSDALIMRFLQEKLGMPIDQAGATLLLFREYREQNSKSFIAWRGDALKQLIAAEQIESDQFLRNFLSDVVGLEIGYIESVVNEFQKMRDENVIK